MASMPRRRREPVVERFRRAEPCSAGREAATFCGIAQIDRSGDEVSEGDAGLQRVVDGRRELRVRADVALGGVSAHVRHVHARRGGGHRQRHPGGLREEAGARRRVRALSRHRANIFGRVGSLPRCRGKVLRRDEHQQPVRRLAAKRARAVPHRRLVDERLASRRCEGGRFAVHGRLLQTAYAGLRAPGASDRPQRPHPGRQRGHARILPGLGAVFVRLAIARRLSGKGLLRAGRARSAGQAGGTAAHPIQEGALARGARAQPRAARQGGGRRTGAVRHARVRRRQRSRAQRRSATGRRSDAAVMPTGDKVDYIGETEEWKKIDRMVQKVAPIKTNVLLLGETGTGKEVVARALHRRSGRTGEFVAINCGALPRDLLATELFGYEGGAFTGARETGAVGKFEFADGGTLFLDEIGEMPVDMQVSLLRVLQEQSVTKLGSNTAKTLDVRVIAATNQNIERLISEKKFRSDLYYRLSLVEIRLPQLRRRSADIPPLVDYFNRQLSSVLEVPCTPFPAETIEALQAQLAGQRARTAQHR
ncbi:MAG: sigma 54-interacting transcriptional regulator [Eggerthella lenta]